MSKSSRSPSRSSAEQPITARSNLNCLIVSVARFPTSPPSARRSCPPVRITSHPWLPAKILATFMLLVRTMRFSWCINSIATASVEVPMFRNSEIFPGICAAQARAMARLASDFSDRRSSYPILVVPEDRTAPPCTRSRRPASAKSVRSRRIVCKVTPKCSASPSTVTFPSRRAISSISGWRNVCDITGLSFFPERDVWPARVFERLARNAPKNNRKLSTAPLVLFAGCKRPPMREVSFAKAQKRKKTKIKLARRHVSRHNWQGDAAGEKRVTESSDTKVLDLLIVGGGINGCGIARDAAGRGLSVAVVEMNDLASATSSASTKLFHGGLRYLEYFEFRLVREALIERETLLRAMPHISWPMRFVLPYHKDMRFDSDTPTSKLLGVFMPWTKGRRPAWLIRLGLFMYDHLGGRKILPGTKTLDLSGSKEGRPLQERFTKAYEYSDCWVEDSRLVVLNARDAEARGARILTRARVVSAARDGDLWRVTVDRDGTTGEITARALVNAGGPWVGDIIQNVTRQNTPEKVRLVRGSHIVTRRLYDHDKCYFFQGTDGRIIFAIPYETDFTLIGTTDQEHQGPPGTAVCTPEERDYLLRFASQYFARTLTAEDVVWTYSGVRPLYDDGASSATAATRDYVLSLDDTGAALLNVFGGKITTYRRLAEAALAKLAPSFPKARGDWTAGVTLPGGDFAVDGFDDLVSGLRADYPFLSDRWARRLARAYGTEARAILGDAKTADDLGRAFGATLTEVELRWLMAREYARTAEDVIWRRSKLGLRLTGNEIAALDAFMADARAARAAE